MKGFKIFCACFFGAGIGAFIALEINPYFWWTGMIIGGLVGYLIYEYQEVGQAIRVIWHSMVNIKKEEILYGLSLAIMIIALVHMISAILINLLASIAMIVPFLFSERMKLTTIVDLNLLALTSSIIAGIILTILHLSTNRINDYKEEIKYNIKIILKYNIFSVLFYWLPKGIYKGIVLIPTAIKFTSKFIKQVFVLIHTDIRLL